MKCILMFRHVEKKLVKKLAQLFFFLHFLEGTFKHFYENKVNKLTNFSHENCNLKNLETCSKF